MGLDLAGKYILVHCDNQAVVSVLSTGKTRDALLAAIARNIFIETARLNISLKTIHILGKNNLVADLLSRWQDSQIQVLLQYIPDPIWVNPPSTGLHIDWCI